MFFIGYLLVVVSTFTVLVYTAVGALAPKKRRDAVARASTSSMWPVWLSEMENPYSILNSRAACFVLAPLMLILLCVELWWLF